MTEASSFRSLSSSALSSLVDCSGSGGASPAGRAAVPALRHPPSRKLHDHRVDGEAVARFSVDFGNGRVAFGFTIFSMDQEDLYVYRTRPGDPRSYWYDGAWGYFRSVPARDIFTT